MAKKLWGGRFKKEIDRDFFEFQKSIQYDYKLAGYDIYHSVIHVSVLKEAGLLSREEADKLHKALNEIYEQIEKGEFKPDYHAEDIHTDIQNRVEKKVGKTALKLHTLRSRNDQIVFDEKYYCSKEGTAIHGLLYEVINSLIFLSKKYAAYYIPGYTHTQRAQVVAFRDYIGTFICMFKRDFDRINDYLDHLVFYLGAGALAGTALPKEAYRNGTKKYLDEIIKKFPQTRVKMVENPLDNVSNRDFIIEFLSIVSLLQMHLSRLAEDFILYSTKEFHFLDLPEEFCTGSSLMPHKKNPDFLELARGYTGRIYGNLISILTTMKGLPLTYNRDMQIDKEFLFSSVEIIKNELGILARFIREISVNEAAIKGALADENLYATELAEFLVYKNVAFKEAHDIIGRLIRYAQDKGVKIKEMPDSLLKTFHAALERKVINKIMNPVYAVSSKKSIARKVPKIHA